MGRRPKGKSNRDGGAKWADKPVQKDSNGWHNLDLNDPATKVNLGFEEYYKGQGIIEESEWPAMLESLRTELPTTFRVTGSRAHAETINDIIKEEYIPTMQNVEWEGKTYDPPQHIPWYPGQLAWTVSAPKRVVRKTEPFKRFQRFLVGETEVGNLSRQEAVSMIPPLLLDVQPHHNCMDMCAAPGSKTAQIIEALNPHNVEPTGFLMANDSDYKRTHMLVHQTGRMPSKGLVVTNLDASMIPNISLGNDQILRFDRILADVPCSGDGTLRKNAEIWKKWTASDGNSLHTLQIRILDRGMKQLKPGGRLVYSTCSFNPAENEAVVAAALNAHPDEFSIVDVSNLLPNLKRRPGKTSWKVASQSSLNNERKINWHESYAEYQAAVDALPEGDKEKGKMLASTLWAPENAAELGLDRALRLLPHDQDTGGFFVCVLEKKETAADTLSKEPTPAVELPEVAPLDDVVVADETGSSSLKRAASPSGVADAEPEVKKAKSGPSKAALAKQAKKQKRDTSFKEDAFSFVDPGHAEIKSISDWFKMKDDFPKNNLLVRNDYGDPLRVMYMANDTVKTIIQNNDFSRLRIVSAGVKAFVRQDSQARTEIPCKWRIPGEGLLEVIKHVGDDVIRDVTIVEMKVLLKEMYPPVTRFTPDVLEWMNQIKPGNVIVKVAPGEVAGGKLSLPMFLPLWRAKTSMSLLIDKKEKGVLSLRVFGEEFVIEPWAHDTKQGANAEKTDEAADQVEVPEGESAGVVATAEEAAVAQAEEEEAENKA